MKTQLARPVSIILLVATCLHVAAASQDAALDLVHRYAQNQEKLRSFSCKYKSETTAESQRHGQYSHLSGKRLLHISGVLRLDSARYSFREYKWGNVFSAQGSIPQEEATYFSLLWDGDKFWRFSSRRTDTGLEPGNGWVAVTPEGQKQGKEGLCAFPTCVLAGFICDHVRMDSILRESKSISLHPDNRTVGSCRCRIIVADTKHGKITVAIDPSRGYNILWAEIDKQPGHAMYGGTIPAGMTDHTVLKDVELKLVGGVWAPIKATEEKRTKHPNGDFSNSTTVYYRSDLRLNPDFDAMKAFVPNDIPDGACFFNDKTGRNVGYTWRHGKLVPDTEVEEEKESRR